VGVGIVGEVLISKSMAPKKQGPVKGDKGVQKSFSRAEHIACGE